jgi:hypothetical protein
MRPLQAKRSENKNCPSSRAMDPRPRLAFPSPDSGVKFRSGAVRRRLERGSAIAISWL